MAFILLNRFLGFSSPVFASFLWGVFRLYNNVFACLFLSCFVVQI